MKRRMRRSELKDLAIEHVQIHGLSATARTFRLTLERDYDNVPTRNTLAHALLMAKQAGIDVDTLSDEELSDTLRAKGIRAMLYELQFGKGNAKVAAYQRLAETFGWSVQSEYTEDQQREMVRLAMEEIK